MSEPTKAVFLSYARDDAAAARRIAEALRIAGLEVWFDENELRGGDQWDAKIRKQIDACTLFIPVVSQHTQDRSKGYFRLEWKLAVDQTHLLAEGVPFIAPVVIDDTRESAAVVPPEFMRVQWSRLPGALPTPQFVEQVKRLLAGPVSRGGSGSRPTAAGSGDPALQKKAIPSWTWGALTAVVVGIAIALSVSRKPGASPDPKFQTPAPKSALVTIPVAPLNDKSIAVIPFENRSTDKEANAVFTDGIHEDILTNLAHIREFRVISRTSVEQYRKTTKTIPQIARELGVTYILEGSVQRDGNKVRVTGQLIKAATDEHIWAENYTRDLTDIFALQSELAKAIANELKTTLSPQEKNLLERRPTENLAAYEVFVKARDLAYSQPSFTPPVPKKLETLLQSAVDLDPKFAVAWAYLATTHSRMYFTGSDRTPARLGKAQAAMDRAIALEPDSPEVIYCLGTYYYQSQRDYDRATEQIEKLLRLQPNDALAWGFLGVIQRSQGRWVEALASTRKAVQLDPASISHARNLLGSLRCVRRFDEAMAVARRLAAMDPLPLNQLGIYLQTESSATGDTKEAEAWMKRVLPVEEVEKLQKGLAIYRGDLAEAIRLDKLQPNSVPTALGAGRVQALYMAEIYQAVGDQAAARARLGNFRAGIRTRLETEPTNTQLWQALSRMEAILGHKEEALRCAIKATELPEAKDGFDGPPAWNNLAVIHAWLGDKDRAIAQLEEILRKPSYLTVRALKRSPAYFTLRGDPRFEALVNDPKNNQPLF